MIPGQFHERLNQLSPARRALLQRRLARLSTAADREPEIPRRSSKKPCVTSFCQQQLWLLDQLTPGTSTYNVPYATSCTSAPWPSHWNPWSSVTRCCAPSSSP
jgi:hypothetical protein